MKRFVVTLSDEHRAKLEAYRKRLGLRSEAEAMRKMIGLSGVDAPAPMPEEDIELYISIGTALDKIGYRMACIRKDGEPDHEYRLRIKSGRIFKASEAR